MPNFGIVCAMPDAKKQEYYRKNREKRLQYQREYYRSNKEVFERKEELLKTLDPEEWKKRRKKRADYNKEYYRKNRNSIRAKQKARYQKRKEAQGK
jgi:hypothetical protein|tara:strand:+ start:47 stop:334 length:288 start_codon:yes stop_codon:yes gene_type:complete